MAEAIVFTLTAMILNKLGSTTLQQIGLAVCVKQELRKLDETLATVKVVLLDAEQKQSTDNQLRLWLERLQHVLYDADNVLDTFEYKAIRQRLPNRGSIKEKVRQVFTSVKFRFGMSYKIKELRERLDQIAIDKTQFHLTERHVDHHVMHRATTHSFVNPYDVIGRDIDKKNIIDLLTHGNNDLTLSIIPIVGIGGLGKTTIAKLVYNSKEVSACFELRMWVCVSNDFDEQKLTKDIIVAATERNDCSGLSFDLLQTRLRDTLEGKKFLLVLDDVWNENQQQWNELRQLLINGAKGSKIIVTTRSRKVASIMGTIEAYSLKIISDEDCWSLFSKYAFGERGEENYQNLVRIGKDIIKKCKGVPLAVITLGSMLSMKTEEREWLSIEKNEIWRLDQNENDILPALSLSYTQLPSHLKKCFSVCSIFPKDFNLNSRELIAIWMSHGLIQSPVENEELEETGLRYIKELHLRCFFQDIHDFGHTLLFKMHDLVHDLALLVAQNECYTINKVPLPSTKSKKIRHMSICITEDVVLPPIELDLSNLWTFYFFPNSKEEGADELLVRTCIPKFKFLRMLDMCFLSFDVLPESIGRLHHLRYLNISGNRKMKKLPDAICKLLHLQTLDLSGCTELEGLPRDIGNLVKLRRLDVTAKKIYLVPNKQIGLLTNLGHLSFSCCDNLISGSSSDGMECTFRFLRSLTLVNLDNLECWPDIMKHLPTLETLFIHHCDKLNLIEEPMFPSLRYLYLYRLDKLECLPGWIEGCSNTLHTLHIADCSNITSLPNWIQNLTSLVQLWIRWCPEISEGIAHLTSLTELIIEWCPKLSDRCKRGEDWHKIKHIPYIVIDDDRMDDDWMRLEERRIHEDRMKRLQEEEANRNKRLQEEEANRMSRLQEEEANRMRRLQEEEANRMKKLQEEEANRNKRLQEEEADKKNNTLMSVLQQVLDRKHMFQSVLRGGVEVGEARSEDLKSGPSEKETKDQKERSMLENDMVKFDKVAMEFQARILSTEKSLMENALVVAKDFYT